MGRPARPLASWFVDRIELSRGTAGQNVRPMEGLRGIAVLMVFFVHFSTLMGPHVTGPLAAVADALHVIGNRGVDLFFVLSGYLIYGSLMGRPQAFGLFMMRRVERIYPAFLVVFSIYLVLVVVHPTDKLVPADPTGAVLYIAANLLLLPGLLPIEPLVTVAWSLSYELFYYLAIPLMLAGLALRDRPRIVRVALFVGLAATLATYCYFHAGPVRLVMFVAGIVLFETIKSRCHAPPKEWIAVFAVAAAFAATLIPTLGSAGYMAKTLLLAVAFYALCFASFERPGSPLARAVGVTPLRWLGNMSYSYYLFHSFALKIAFLAITPFVLTASVGPALFGALAILLFSWTLVPTVVLYLAIEYPLSLSPRRPWRAPNALEASAIATHRAQSPG